MNLRLSSQMFTLRSILRKLMKNTVKLIVLLFFFVSGIAHANDRNGNWWRNLDPMQKVMYVNGFFDGTDLGYSFATWKMVGDKSSLDAKKRASDSFSEHNKRYLSNVTVNQVVDGLDVFYSDFRNRSISTFGATWLVLVQIAGDPNVDEMINSWRKNASRN